MFLLLLHDRRRHQLQNQGHRTSALAFIVRIFVNDAIAIAVWTRFHVRVCIEVERSPSEFW
jgi:hypothetical protein